MRCHQKLEEQIESQDFAKIHFVTRLVAKRLRCGGVEKSTPARSPFFAWKYAAIRAMNVQIPRTAKPRWTVPWSGSPSTQFFPE
jgi:hypothetical protein